MKGLVTGWDWEIECTLLVTSCTCPSFSAKQRLYSSRKEVNATRFPFEWTKTFAFFRNLLEFWQPSKEILLFVCLFVFLNLALLAVCCSYCIFSFVWALSEQPCRLAQWLIRRIDVSQGREFMSSSSALAGLPLPHGCNGKFGLWVLLSLRFCCCACKIRA